jgi:hypothetical protein
MVVERVYGISLRVSKYYIIPSGGTQPRYMFQSTIHNPVWRDSVTIRHVSKYYIIPSGGTQPRYMFQSTIHNPVWRDSATIRHVSKYYP